MLAPDIYNFASKYGYKIKVDSEKVFISSKFNPTSSISILIYFLSLIGIIFILFQLLNPKSFFFIILGFFSLSISLIIMILQLNNEILIQNKMILIKSRFKSKSIEINNATIFKMKTEKYYGRSGKSFIYVEIFLEHLHTENYVLSFIENTDDEKNAVHFGSEIKQVLNQYKNKFKDNI